MEGKRGSPFFHLCHNALTPFHDYPVLLLHFSDALFVSMGMFRSVVGKRKGKEAEWGGQIVALIKRVDSVRTFFR